MIRSALIDWADNPVITSLDSIATPIDSMQFPTITVCKDETKEQPDNWAYLEKLLNHLSFKCNYYLPDENIVKDCPYSKELRKDFRFAYEYIVKIYEKWILDSLEHNKTIPMKNTLESSLQSGFQDIISHVRKKTSEGYELYDELKRLAIDMFAKDPTPLHIEKMIGNMSGEIDKKSFKCGASVKCLKGEMITRILIEMSKKGTPFGFLMRNFMEIINFRSFSQMESILALEYDLWFGLDFDKEKICDYLTKNEKFVHEYFSNLSLSVNFSKNELNDLYELPGLLGTLVEIPWEYDSTGYGFDMKLFQVPFSTICNKDPSISIDNITQCGFKIQDFIENPWKGN